MRGVCVWLDGVHVYVGNDCVCVFVEWVGVGEGGLGRMEKATCYRSVNKGINVHANS